MDRGAERAVTRRVSLMPTQPSLSSTKGLPPGQLTCSHLRPVGGCLQNYQQHWSSLTQDMWVLNCLRLGYAPEFEEGLRPPLTDQWPLYESGGHTVGPNKARDLQLQIEDLLEKGAIEKVVNTRSQGYYSRLFLVPKKNGKLRPVIDLKELNKTLKVPKLKMETSISVAAAVRPGDWTTSIDLADAFFHVPILPSFRKYLRLVVNGRVYQFKALPFGLSTSPLVFTKVAPMAAFLRSQGILFHQYLDDFLIRSQDKAQC